MPERGNLHSKETPNLRENTDVSAVRKKSLQLTLSKQAMLRITGCNKGRTVKLVPLKVQREINTIIY